MPADVDCEFCQKANQRAAKMTSSEHVTHHVAEPGDKVDADLVGPTSASVNKEIYGFITKDEGSNYLKAAGLKSKSAEEVKAAFMRLYLGESVPKVFRTDGGAEFQGIFHAYLLRLDVTHAIGNLPNKPSTGARVERMVQLVSNGVRVTRLRSGLPYQFWTYCMIMFCRNFSTTSINPRSGKTPYEDLRGHPPPATALPFGCRAIYREHDPKIVDNKAKFDPKASEGVIIGYGKLGSVYLLDLEQMQSKKVARVVLTRDFRARSEEFPFFFNQQFSAEAERTLGMLFATGDQQSARGMLEDENGRCVVCSLHIRGGPATCEACNGKHRKHEEDASCKRQRCGGHLRAEVLAYADRVGNGMFSSERRAAVEAFSGKTIVPQSEGAIDPTSYAPVEGGGEPRAAPQGQEDEDGPAPLVGAARPGSRFRPVVLEEAAGDSEDDLFAGLRNVTIAGQEPAESDPMDELIGPRTLSFGSPSRPAAGAAANSTSTTPETTPEVARNPAPLGFDTRRLRREEDGAIKLIGTPFGLAVIVAPEAVVAEGMPANFAERHRNLARTLGQALPEEDEIGPGLATVTQVVNPRSNEAKNSEGALQSVEKERENIEDKWKVWDVNQALEWDAVQDKGARVLRAHLILGKKRSEFGADEVIWKARIVANGAPGQIKDWFGEDSAGDELYTLPVSAAGVRTIASVAVCTPGWEAMSFDIDGAYLQTPRPDTDVMYCRIPKQLLSVRMTKMRDPVVRLAKKLYGEPDSGDLYAAWMEQRLQDQGWRRAESDLGTVYLRKNMILGLYVDDGVAAGARQPLILAIAELGKAVRIKEAGLLDQFLGSTFRHLLWQGKRALVIHQREYTQYCVERFSEDNGGPARSARTPTLSPGTENNIPEDQPARLGGVARKHIGALLFLARNSRGDISFSVGAVARDVLAWGARSDAKLLRIFGYLQGTINYGVLSFAADGKAENTVDLSRIELRQYADADHGGCEQTARSTSGWCAYLATPEQTVQCLIDWGSRRQTAVARSTTEAEIVAIADSVTKTALPLAGLVEEAMGRENVAIVQFCDNDASRLIVESRRAGKMAHLRKHQRVTVGFCSDVFRPHGGNSIRRVHTDLNVADIFTKGMKNEQAFEKHVRSLGLVDISIYEHLFREMETLERMLGPVRRGYASAMLSASRQVAGGGLVLLWALIEKAFGAAVHDAGFRDMIYRALLRFCQRRGI